MFLWEVSSLSWYFAEQLFTTNISEGFEYVFTGLLHLQNDFFAHSSKEKSLSYF